MIEKLEKYHNNQDDFSNKINEIIDHLNQQEEKNYIVKCGECGDEFRIENEGEDTCDNCA